MTCPVTPEMAQAFQEYQWVDYLYMMGLGPEPMPTPMPEYLLPGEWEAWLQLPPYEGEQLSFLIKIMRRVIDSFPGVSRSDLEYHQEGVCDHFPPHEPPAPPPPARRGPDGRPQRRRAPGSAPRDQEQHLEAALPLEPWERDLLPPNEVARHDAACPTI